MKLTLRAKGFIAFSALVVYTAMVGFVMSRQSAGLLRVAADLEQVYSEESALAKAGYSVSNSMLKWQDGILASPDLAASILEQVALDVELAQASLQLLLPMRPELAADIEQMTRGLARLRADPSRASLTSLHDQARDLNQRLDRLMQQVRGRKGLLWDGYRGMYADMTLTGTVLGAVGAVAFGAAMTLFLSRLARDVKLVAARALEIVSGHRSPPVPVTRDDEIGSLMAAVNRMESELRRWEHQLEMAHEQRFHKEKMAAIGSLAAAVAHEINNPIAAIVGVAQSMQARAGEAGIEEAARERLALIVDQARRIAAISRQIAELTAPHPAEPQLLDLNTLVRNTCKFIAYDRRFDNISLALELDSDIPAIRAIADHLTQVLMNLVINAADALEEVTRAEPTICVGTSAADGGAIVLTVRDNGKGMNRDVLARAFENAYTTKPPHKGRGLGLSLCKSLIEGSGNRIELESTPDVGTTARIHLMPARPAGA